MRTLMFAAFAAAVLLALGWHFGLFGPSAGRDEKPVEVFDTSQFTDYQLRDAALTILIRKYGLSFPSDISDKSRVDREKKKLAEVRAWVDQLQDQRAKTAFMYWIIWDEQKVAEWDKRAGARDALLGATEALERVK